MSTVDSSNAAIDTVTEGIDKVDISHSIKNDDTSEVLQETCVEHVRLVARRVKVII